MMGLAGDARGERVFDLLRTDEVDVPVDPARRDDAALRRDDLRRRPDGHARGDAALHERVARMADGRDPAVFYADVRLDDALHGVEDQGVGEHEVERFGVERERRLAHAVADDLAAAELHLVAVAAALGDEVALDLDEQLRVGEANAVARGRSEHFGVLPP